MLSREYKYLYVLPETSTKIQQNNATCAILLSPLPTPGTPHLCMP